MAGIALVLLGFTGVQAQRLTVDTGGTKGRAIEVLLEVMEQRPNYPTFRTAFDLVRRGYRGTPEAGTICATSLHRWLKASSGTLRAIA